MLPIRLRALLGAHWTVVAAISGALAPGALGADPPTATADLALYLSSMATNGSGGVGTRFLFGITVDNQGPDGAPGVQVQAPLPAGLAFHAATPPPDGSVTQADGSVSFSFPDLGPGASRNCTLELVAETPGLKILSATASSTTATDPNPANNAYSISVDVAPTATADLALYLDVTSTNGVGALIHGTVEVSNHGPGIAGNVEVQIPFPDGTIFVSGEPAAEGWVGMTAEAVVFGMGDMPAGASRTARVGFQATRLGWVTVSATAASTANDPSAGNNVSAVSVEIAALPELRITSVAVDHGMVVIQWTGGTARLQGCPDLGAPVWKDLVDPSTGPAKLPSSQEGSFFRLVR